MLTPVEAVTLAALSDRPRYGYELVQRIAELTDRRLVVRPGNLYRVIDRLMAEGFVVETSRHEPDEGDERRRWFTLTTAGARAAAEELYMYGQVLKRTPELRELLSHV
jgi:DNA-binding PadR family transcriptional regulator